MLQSSSEQWSGRGRGYFPSNIQGWLTQHQVLLAQATPQQWTFLTVGLSLWAWVAHREMSSVQITYQKATSSFSQGLVHLPAEQKKTPKLNWSSTPCRWCLQSSHLCPVLLSPTGWGAPKETSSSRSHKALPAEQKFSSDIQMLPVNKAG